MKRGLGVFLLLALALGAVGYVVTAGRSSVPEYRMASIDRGSIVETTSASGSLNAVTTVQVGSQVSGQIAELHVDFNSRVRKGQLIARLDPEILEAKLRAAQADLENARAAVLNQRANLEKSHAEIRQMQAAVLTAEANAKRVEADIENARAVVASARANVARESATVANAERELARRADLLRQGLISQSEKDQAQTAFDTAEAQLSSAEAQARAGLAALRSAEAQLLAARSQVRAGQAQLASAHAALGVAEAQLKAADATVLQKDAALAQAQVNLEHTRIRSPIDGVVVSRSVDVGQTVAASLQAPTLFTIAQDLTQMQVHANVDEADIGRIQIRQRARFRVDSFPGKVFEGEVREIRKGAQVIQNVVTYDVIISAPNPEERLLPGMTANVEIVVDHREAALRVPNAALRFRPRTEDGLRIRRHEPATEPRGGGNASLRGRVWVLGQDGKPVPRRIRLGITDGAFTEVLGGDLAPGEEVIEAAVEPADGRRRRRGPRLRF